MRRRSASSFTSSVPGAGSATVTIEEQEGQCGRKKHRNREEGQVETDLIGQHSETNGAMPPATAATDDKPERDRSFPGARDSARDTDGQWTAIPRPTTKSAVTMTHARVKVEATKKASVSTMERRVVDRAPPLRQSATDDASTKRPAGHGGERRQQQRDPTLPSPAGGPRSASR